MNKNWSSDERQHPERSHFRHTANDEVNCPYRIRSEKRVSALDHLSDDQEQERRLNPDPKWLQDHNNGETLERCKLLRQMSEKLKYSA